MDNRSNNRRVSGILRINHSPRSYQSYGQLWENTWKGSKFVRSVMTYNRFEMILKAWHYVDYAHYSAEEIKLNKNADPFWPVAALEEDLNVLFRERMKAGQCVDIDEQCIPWKGRHKCRCYNKSKPIKRHFKIFSLNDSRSGYQHAFYLYRGKSENRPPNVTKILLDLLK